MHVKKWNGLLLVGIFLNTLFLIEVTGQSQEYPPNVIRSDFIYKNWTVRNGLPVNSISSVVQTKDGYLWLGTGNGLVRFDGVDFKLFTTADYPDLLINRIKGLAEYEKGILILNSNQDFVHFIDGEFLKLETPESFRGQLISWMFQGENKEIIIPVSKDQYELSDGEFKKLETSEKYQIRNRKTDKYSWQVFGNSISFEGERILNFSDRINDVILDKEGSLWIATYSNGFYQIKKNFFKVFSEEEGIPNRNTYPVIEAQDQTMWIGTFGGGLASIKDEIVTTGYVFKGAPSSGFVQDIIQLRNQEILVALLNSGMYRYSGDQIFTPFPEAKIGGVLALFEDSKERLWAGTTNGIYLYKNESWEPFDFQGLKKATIQTIFESPDGTIWFGSKGQGIFFYNGNSFRVFSKKDGLSSNMIRSLWAESAEIFNSYTLWVGTSDNGLNGIQIENGEPNSFNVSTINKEQGLFDKGVHKIIEDEMGRVWMSSNNGIFWIYKYELEQFKKGIVSKVTSNGFTEQDGLRSREANGGFQHAGTKTQNGDIWFPTQDGIVKIVPRLIERNTLTPPVFIDKIVSQKKVFENVPDAIELSRGDRNLSLSFTSLSFISPEKNRFRYRLYGFDKEWTEVKERNVRYTNLEPGKYTFRVIASNNNGIWNSDGDTLSIIIPPFFYESVWFYALLAILFGLHMLFMFMLMKKSADKKFIQKEKELVHQTKSLQNLREKFASQKKLKETLLVNLREEFREPILSLQNETVMEKEDVKKVIHTYTSEMLTQLDQLLLIAEIEIDQRQLKLEFENLPKVVEDVVLTFKDLDEFKDLEIDFSTNSEFVNIYIDSEMVRILISTLLRNSSKTDGVSSIKIQVVEESSFCTFKVKDNGTAYPQKKIRSIFNLIELKETDLQNRKLLALELPLIAKLVELHKANIVVHSIPGTGNTFSIIFKKGSKHLSE